MAAVLTCGLLAASGLAQSTSPRRLLAEARQLLLVTTPDWHAVDGTLLRYERTDGTQPWTLVGLPVPIVVGGAGMAWDAAWLDPKPVTGPIKKEGDQRSPAGVFTLSRAFGYADAASAGAVRLPYQQATETLECVDDANSTHYNRLVERAHVQADWASAERMRRSDEFYRLGVVVDYNTRRPVAGHGSCIFLHIWSSAGHGTAGCTAMSGELMAEVLAWLDPAAKPVLVQFPAPVVDRIRVTWRLP